MKVNEISFKELRPDAVEWFTKLHQILMIKEYGKGTVRNYCGKMKLLFKYFNYKAVVDIGKVILSSIFSTLKKYTK